MRLFHYSDALITEVRPVTSHPRSAMGKPSGLWVSVDDAWADWCAREQFGCGAVVTEVTLRPDANVCVIEGEAALRAFDADYAFGDRFGRRIDWSAVAAQYDGIVIAPYIWACRYDLDWYYGWDVASGCIWHPRAVATLAPATDVPVGQA